MYAITGISGRVGGAIAENLLAQGEQIRAIVRNAERQRIGGTAEQRLLLRTSTIRTHWHPHLQERMAYFS